MNKIKTIFETGAPGRCAVMPEPLDVPDVSLPEVFQRDTPLALTELSEMDVVRHFTRLSRRNFGVDSHFYPLGSCTMKYNPKISESVASLPGFASLHPGLTLVPAYRETCQGALEVVYELERLLAEIAGMAAGCLQPMAGAHGELTGVLLIAAYHRSKNDMKRDTILIPDSAHGTNPASAAMAGFKTVTLPSNAQGSVDYDAYAALMGEHVAGVMLTCPNTHGLFEPHVAEIAALAHEHGALMYYDGANLNAILGKCRPGDLGFDVMHYNLHKTFGTPHGMGGPGSGAIAVGERLAPFLPNPRVVKNDGIYDLHFGDSSIGRMAPFFGNFLVALRAYVYILAVGGEGLKKISENAVLNANYVLARLKEHWRPAFDGLCMHECLLTAADMTADHGIRALDVAKALLDRGFHAPTVYFPLTVKEGLMIEPTETESQETLDDFCDAMLEIARSAIEDPESLHHAPVSLPVGRLNEAQAARNLDCAALPQNKS
ncbi:MAG: aminomethyl-transferring glycine dehydrogenase subunit GcvPB [Candidatus Hydrogenedentes bacterium]|nr:aminomethyl-transferring glycine dehydrogenase subunit GcvPB [Candidatus Hydrogenedentota bacterium]